MAEGDKPLTHAGNIKSPSISVVIGWVKIAWECIPIEILRKSLKCGISNTMNGTKVGVLYEDFLGEGVAETEDVADNNGYADYYDNSPATHEILAMAGPAFLWRTRMIPIFKDFNNIIRQKIL